DLGGRRKQLANTLRFRCRDDVVQGEIRRGEGIGHAAGRYSCGQVCHQWHRHASRSGAARWRSGSANNRRNWQRWNKAGDWTGSDGAHTSEQVATAGGRAAESELRTKLARKGAVGGNDPCFDFNLLRTL